MKRLLHSPARTRQAGAVLIVSLILLTVLTLFVLASMSYTNTQSRIAGNLQVRNELKAVNQQAIEAIISAPINSTVVEVPFDVNGDGKDDYKVTVTPTCISSVTIPIDQLDITKEDDASCTITGAMQNPGIVVAGPNNASLCANAIWDLKAVGVDAATATFVTAASVTTHQGVGVRTAVGSGC